MPEIRPFRALRYDFDRLDGVLSAVIAPPYDVLDQADKDLLQERNPRNIVTIDLPHLPPKEEGPREAYAGAQAALAAWLREGVLLREGQPALYLYHQAFEVDGQRYTRRSFIAALRLHAFEEGEVLPHEKTFGGPKADRLALTREVRCNVSPVFGLYPDPDHAVAAAFSAAEQRRPDAIATLDEVENRVWVVADEATIRKVGSALTDRKVFIADGHHRYTTALNYRDELAASAGGLPVDHPANYVMVVLASMDDPGCIIQGYCRVLSGEKVNGAALTTAWSEGLMPGTVDDHDLGLYDGATRQMSYVKFRDRSVLAKLAPERHASWRALDVAYIHTYLIDELLTKAGVSPDIGYVKSEAGARDRAEANGGVAVIPKATPMAHLRAVSEAGELMPQKSTFFYPKVATGLALYPLYPDE